MARKYLGALASAAEHVLTRAAGDARYSQRTSGLEASLPVSGSVAGAEYYATDTKRIWSWGGSTWTVLHDPATHFRNWIRNGNLTVWQRGGGAFTSGYAADGFKLDRTGSTISTTRQSFTLGNQIPGVETPYYMRHVVTSSVGASNYAQFYPPIESVRTFAGQQVTWSFWAKADAARNICVEFYQHFGSGGSAGVGGIGSQLIALTTSWTRHQVTVSIPSIAGKTIGTDGMDVLVPVIWMDAGSTYNTRAASLGQQSGTFDFWGLQLEPGATASAFRDAPVGDVVAECVRYFERLESPTAAYNVFGTGQCLSTTVAAITVPFTPKRDRPTVTLAAAGNFVVTSANGTAITCSSVGYQFPTRSAVQIDCTVASGLVAGNSTKLHANATTGAYIDISAEL